MGSLPSRSAAAILAACLLAVTLIGCEPAPPVTANGCGLTPTAGLIRRSLGDRSYLVLVPDGLAGHEAAGVPVVMSLHGLNSNATQMAGYTPWVSYVPTAGFIAVFPEAVNGTWHMDQGSADVTFLRSVVTDVSTTWCVNPKRVDVDGHSLGGYMAERLACDAPDVVAAVTTYGAGPPTLTGTPCTPPRPVAVALFHGEQDKLVNPALGASARDGWVARDGCGTTPISETVTSGTSLRYVGCSDGVEVRWRTYANEKHLWPTGDDGTDLGDRMWSFFQAFPKP